MTQVDGATYTAALKAAEAIGSIEDRCYHTVRYGTVQDYRGSVDVTLPDGRRFRVTGRGPTGSVGHVARDGCVEVIPLD